ncbi:hypothetical protein Tco_0803751 [Tanacetum coccineum]|uniref:Reverse transcriptase domain-containing protein n=1 Tax=Tanacetum coccineum TaxID=301880 RepID=A0ABQ5A6X9_9ASTR
MQNSSVNEPPKVELKDLPPHLEYAFLEGNDKLPVIIAKDLKNEEKAALIEVLKSHKRAIAWKLSDIKGITQRLESYASDYQRKYNEATRKDHFPLPFMDQMLERLAGNHSIISSMAFQVFPYGTVELSQNSGPNFKVNGHRLKHYFGGDIPAMDIPDLQTFPKTTNSGNWVKLSDPKQALRCPGFLMPLVLAVFVLRSQELHNPQLHLGIPIS